MRSDFIPTQAADIDGPLDFILVSGDAYVDHPSFGTALIGRYLQSLGYTCGIIAQPEFHSKDDFMRLGRPKLGFMIAAGNMDSMVSNYTSSKKKRNQDYFSPKMEAGHRPDRATIVYCNRVREAFPHVPIIIAGVEASLRRFAHYDYWDDKVRRSLLVDAGADMLIYGMAERATKEVCRRMAEGERLSEIQGVPGTCYMTDELPDGVMEIPSYEAVCEDKKTYAECFAMQYLEHDPIRGRSLAQRHGEKYVVVEKPAMPLNRKELDELAKLKYMRTWHPDYDDVGGIAAIQEVKFSITANRGCFGECAFCALAFHQGKIVQSRSVESIVEEAKELTKLPDFKGYIHDIGGPTANFMRPACDKQLKLGTCKGKRCLSPKPCPNLKVDHREYLQALEAVRSLPGIKKVFVRSGVRFDYALLDRSDQFIWELCRNHVSGQLRIAPEHVAPGVLNLMGKPDCSVFGSFEQKFERVNEKLGKDQYIVSYFMSSHPGSTLKEAVQLAEYMRDHRINPDQVQDFYPTPGTRATTMYYTGYDPMTMKQVYVPKSYEEKAMQRALLQYRNPQNHDLVRKALMLCGREDLIGYGPRCLVPPKGGRSGANAGVQSAGRQGSTAKDRSGSKPLSRKNDGGYTGVKAKQAQEKPAKKTPRYAQKAKAKKAKDAKR